MADDKERRAAEKERHAERHKAYMEQDFPGYSPMATPVPEHQVVNALNYMAYQFGQINRNLAKLVALMEKRDS
jgi:hypothetical protein